MTPSRQEKQREKDRAYCFDKLFKLSELPCRTTEEEYEYRMGLGCMSFFLDICYDLPASMGHPDLEEYVL